MFVSIAIACNHNNNTPDVSRIKIDVKLDRFEKSFFQVDSNNVAPGLTKVATGFPDFYPDFMQNILGVSGNPGDTTTLSVTKKFLSSSA